MKRSLATRLLLSHLLLVVIALAVFTLVLSRVADRQATAAGVHSDRMAAARMAPWLERYYRERGSWEGLGRLLRDERFMMRLPMPMPRTPMMRRGHEPPTADSHMHGVQDQPILVLAPDGSVIAARGVSDRIVDLRRRDLRQAVPVGEANEPLAYLFVGAMANPERNPLRQLILSTMQAAALITALVVLAAAALASWLWTHWLIRPLKALSGATIEMARGQYNTRVPVPESRHELAELAESFNRMAGEIEAQETARRRFVADAAHELRTPLSLLAARVDMLADGVYQPGAEQWDALRDGIGRLNGLVADLQTLARLEAGRLELRPVSVAAGELLSEAAASFEPMASERDVTIEVLPAAPPTDLAVSADRRRALQVLANLLSNALRYAPPRSRVVLDAQRTADARVEFRVEDNGPGIAPEDRERVFERFVRLDGARDRERGGSGLGLAIAAELVRQHGGTIRVETARSGSGSRFCFTLPAAPAAGTPSPPRHPRA